MLKRLHLKNFTVFADADFEFGPGLNVLVGTNGTGKSHVLKLGYAVELTRFDISKDFTSERLGESGTSAMAWTTILQRVLPSIFLSARTEPLIRWNAVDQAIIEIDFGDGDQLELYLAASDWGNGRSMDTLGHISGMATSVDVLKPIFIPAKEILTLSWILPASEQLVAPIEKNYIDLLGQLRLLPLRKPEAALAIQRLTEVLDGEVQEESDKYFLVDKTGRRVAISMVAEGLRKFGTLQKLLTNGSLTKGNTLFWDEPEANLNPLLLQKLAAILAELARQGFQIMLATHSTDLLKEFHILSRQKDAQPLPIKYFGLNARPGEATTVVTTDNFEHLPDVVALEVELKQADELEEIFIREDREYYANHPGEQPSL